MLKQNFSFIEDRFMRRRGQKGYGPKRISYVTVISAGARILFANDITYLPQGTLRV